MTVVDVYLKELSDPERLALERIRKIVTKFYPDAREAISYGMPAFKYNGKYLIAYWAFKDHLSIFPTPGVVEAFQSKLTDYTTSKGTIQFTLNKPLPETLLAELLQERVRVIVS